MDRFIDQIICGDSLDILTQMPNESIDLILTDIPYNISQKSNGLRVLDYGTWDHQEGLENKWIAEMVRVTKSTLVCFCGWEQLSFLLLYCKQQGLLTRTLTWIKPNPTPINCDKLYIQASECAVYAKRPGDLICDPFVGSGTTAIAAIKMNRHYIGIDISEEYCNIQESVSE